MDENLRQSYADADRVWRGAFLEAFYAYLKSDEFRELEFTFYAEITAMEWVRLVSGKTIMDNSYLYAKLYYHAGIQEADPRFLPPKLHVKFGTEVAERARALTQEEYTAWVQIQKPPFRAIQGEINLLAADLNLQVLANLITTLLQSNKAFRDEFVTRNGNLLSFVVPYLNALSSDPAIREQQLARLISANQHMKGEV